MILLEHPVVLLLFIPLLLGLYLRYLFPYRGGRISYPFRPWGPQPFKLSTGIIPALRFFLEASFWLGIIALIFALSGPMQTRKERIYLSQGADILIVLDESPSMAGKDFPPENRFEAARQVIRDFLGARENDSFGLVSFGREAALRIPPTRDYDLFTQRLEALQIMDLGDGSALGMGIALAALHLENTTGSNKVIILLTDGANNAGVIQPETAAEIAARSGIRIYTIGIGTDGEIPIEFNHPETGALIRAFSREGYDQVLLQKLASLTGGEYFQAPSPGTLDAVFKAIDSVETIQKRTKIKVHRIPLHRPFLYGGLLLLLFHQFMALIVFREVL